MHADDDTVSRAFPRRVQRATRRHAFTLVELVLTLLVATCLIGLYVRALSEADWLALSLQPARVLNIEQRALSRQRLRGEIPLAGPTDAADPAPEDTHGNDPDRGERAQ